MNKLLYILLGFVFINTKAFCEVLYNLDIYIEPENGFLKGKAYIKNESDKPVFLNLSEFKNSLSKGKYYIKPSEKLSFSFSKRLKSIDKNFVYLINNWYPNINTIAVYTLKVNLPSDFIPISEYEDKKVKINKNRKIVTFFFNHPLEELHLIASNRYVKKSISTGNVKVEAFFFERDEHLIDRYLEKASQYIKLYENLIGRFPYRRFAIVENLLPTGYSMPTFTLIGKDILHYPFILKTSLPHEILHQWFGCSVYVDYQKGNWSEGLTTYLSDHLFSKNRVSYRKKLLLKYMAFVNEKNEYPLKDFKYKKNLIDEAIGYGKGAMVFHMLYTNYGKDTFFKALKEFYIKNKFKRTSWEDIKNSFGKVAGINLENFFNQWINRKGMPEINISDASSYIDTDAFFKVKLTIENKDKYQLSLPIRISSYKREYMYDTNIKDKSENIIISTKDIPLTLYVDRNIDIFRKLTAKEIEPVIYFLLGDNKPLFVLRKRDYEKYKPFLEMFSERETVWAKDFKYSLLEGRNIVILDTENSVLQKLFGKKITKKEMFIKGFKNPFSEEKSIFVFHAPDRGILEKYLPLLRHYGGYTYVSFGKKREKAFERRENGIKVILNEPFTIATEGGIFSYNRFLTSLFIADVIYIGEQHTKFSHHVNQYQIIKDLYEKGMDIVIGMEMFSRDLQRYLDMYISGEISEEEMLKKTNYFKQWKYDYNYYKPILRYAREKKIPVIGLNLDVSIIEKVARKGIDNLSEEEKRKLPKSIDFSNLSYRDFLYRIYSIHSHGDLKKFEYFYQSQLLWDETMAESIADYIKEHPDRKMVVLAGNGHLMYGYGIPDRVKRRVGKSQFIILQDEKIENGKGDFYLYTEPFKGILSKKLGVYVKELKEGLEVDSVIKTSVAEKAGIKKGDIIISFNGNRIKNLSDLKVLLISPPEESVVTVLRNGKKVKLKVKFTNANHLQK